MRLWQHLRSGKDFSRLDVKFSDLTRNQARAIEQYYIENGPNLLNEISSISTNHRFYEASKVWATNYIGK